MGHRSVRPRHAPRSSERRSSVGKALSLLSKARNNMTAIDSINSRRTPASGLPTHSTTQIDARLNDSHTSERAWVAVGGLRRDDNPPRGDEDQRAEQNEICARVSGLVT